MISAEKGGPGSHQLLPAAQTGTGVAPMLGGLGQRHPAVLGSGHPCGSQRVTTCGAPPTDSVLEPELGTPQSTSKRWLAFTGVSFS